MIRVSDGEIVARVEDNVLYSEVSGTIIAKYVPETQQLKFRKDFEEMEIPCIIVALQTAD